MTFCFEHTILNKATQCRHTVKLPTSKSLLLLTRDTSAQRLPDNGVLHIRETLGGKFGASVKNAPIGNHGHHWTKRCSVGEVRVVTSTHSDTTRRIDPNENPKIDDAAIEELNVERVC